MKDLVVSVIFFDKVVVISTLDSFMKMIQGNLNGNGQQSPYM